MIEIETGTSVTTTRTIELPALITARTGKVFLQTLRDNRTGILAWSMGYSVLIAVVTILYPILQENNTLLGIVSSLGLLGVGGGAMNVQALSSFAGYIALQALSWGPLVFSVYIIPQALNAVAREEERGTLDILLSTPISRWRFITEKTLAMIVSMLCILTLMGITLVASIHLVKGINFAVMNAIAGIWHILPITLAIMSITLFLSVTVRNARGAGGWAALFVIASYFVRSMGDLIRDVPLLEFFKQFSIFSYYKSVGVLSSGFLWEYDLSLLGVALVFFVLAVLQFQRRDLGV